MSSPDGALRYRTGEPVRVGDRVLYEGRPGTVTFVQHPDPLAMFGGEIGLRLDGGTSVHMAGMVPPPGLVLAEPASPRPGDPGPA